MAEQWVEKNISPFQCYHIDLKKPMKLYIWRFNLPRSTVHEVLTEFLTTVVRKLRRIVGLPTLVDTLSHSRLCGLCWWWVNHIFTSMNCASWVHHSYPVFHHTGSHITLVKRPKQEPDLYYNRKQQFIVNVLAVCDDMLRTVYYYIGEYSSAHDKRVYRCSKLPNILAAAEPGLLILGKNYTPLCLQAHFLAFITA